MSDANTCIWDELRRVPPEHLKAFTRAGGFKGTAIKPMWSVHRMTEMFGPCGIGWGVDAPQFQTVPAEGELLVYCTVSIWYKPEAGASAKVFGVGGDKVFHHSKDGVLRTDDEAFKKAFTDATGNALKHLGVGADIHMGLWDGNKYIDGDGSPSPSKSKSRPVFTELVNGLKKTTNLRELKEWLRSNKDKINSLPVDWIDHFGEEYDYHKNSFAAAAKPSEPPVSDAPAAALDGRSYDELIADWIARLRAADRNTQEEIFEAEIDPFRESGALLPPDFNALSALIKEAAP